MKLLVNLVAVVALSIFAESTFSSCFVTGMTLSQHRIDMKFENRISTIMGFEELRDEVVSFAKLHHGSQRYGSTEYGFHPYSTHLGFVEKTLRSFGFIPSKNIDARRLLIAAWLHDIIEDTPMTFKRIQLLYGTDMAYLVEAVSKVPSTDGLSKALRTTKTLEKIKTQHPLAATLKLADRIANMTFGLKYEGGIMPKYFSEWAEFKSIIYSPSADAQVQKMWKHADDMLLH